MWLFFLPSGFVRYYVISNLTPAANSRRSREKGEENLFFCEKIISSSSNSKFTWTRYSFRHVRVQGISNVICKLLKVVVNRRSSVSNSKRRSLRNNLPKSIGQGTECCLLRVLLEGRRAESTTCRKALRNKAVASFAYSARLAYGAYGHLCLL